MILAIALISALPAAAQDKEPTVEEMQAGLDRFFGGGYAVDATESRDDGKRAWIVSRRIGSSKAARRCETEFTASEVKFAANTRNTATFRIQWGKIGGVSIEGGFAVVLDGSAARVPNVRFDFPDARLAESAKAGFDLLRRKCAA